MPAEILAFPLARRAGFIRNQAARYLDLTPRGAESNLDHQLGLQRQTLLRKEIDPVVVEREVHALEQAIRNELVRVRFEGVGG